MRLRRSFHGSFAAITALLLTQCEQMPSPLDEGGGRALPDARQGQVAFAAECATCHASGDGFDLAFFNFTDTTIVRRAVAHVDTATALDIVAHVGTLRVQRASRDLRPFQPGGAVLSGDVEFATALFGADAWPADMTSERLRAIDPLAVRAAIALPLWSLENGNLDWMPDQPLPAGVLDDQGKLGRAALAGYQAAPTSENLVRALSALRSAERRTENPAAPCLLEVPERVNYQQCFNVRRWTSTLAAQHMLRYGISGRLHPVAHEIWWDVGNVARKALSAHVPFDNAERNWASWMYLGWIFEPSRFASTYTGSGLTRVGLPRHATFVALRSQVARPQSSVSPYADVESAAKFAPNSWAFQAVRFGYSHLLERIRSGDLPRLEMRADARARVESAYTIASRKIAAAERDALRQAANEVLAALPLN
ncbi:MAG: hypothetical protein HY703_03725 [Gemmatimonadetes bacterium]|nr:hypothetical protein [Gemmatimonadota bacterium]